MTDNGEAESLSGMLAEYARRTEADLARWLVEPDVPETLAEAMRYCCMGAGKRLRPGLVWMCAEAVTDGEVGHDELTARAAVAIELVHCYSLVHDDLPSMDDDTLRRGRPTAHVRFGEAMAVLAGDALLTRAFHILCEPTVEARRSAELVRALAEGAGAAGMIAGQVADMDLCPLPDGIEAVRFIHLRKTASLIRAAARMGAICGEAEPADLLGLTGWAENLGLAYQLVDDVLDVTGSAQQLGKTPGKDAGAGKRTAVAELGQRAAEEMTRQLTDRAVAALAPLAESADRLKELTWLLVRRTH
ncbi:MAG: polyprenyl synthetase family protein [Phycisphaerae bacterium]